MEQATSVAKYFAGLSPRQRVALNRLRKTIRVAAPGATEVLSYGMPTFRLGRMLVSYGAFRDHYSFFPLGSRLLKKFRRELSRYDTSKGTIRFSYDTPLPATLIRKIVRARVKENILDLKAKSVQGKR